MTDREASRQATIAMLQRCARHQPDNPRTSELMPPWPEEVSRGGEILPPSDRGIEGYYPLEPGP